MTLIVAKSLILLILEAELRTLPQLPEADRTEARQKRSLKCRTGNQQSDDQFQKIMQVCRRRYLGYERENTGGGGGGGRDYNGRDTDSQESSDSRSEEDLLDGKFLGSGGSGRGYSSKNSERMSGRYDYAGASSSPRNGTRQYPGRGWSGRSGSSSNGNGNRSPYDDGQSGYGSRRGMNNNGGQSDSGYSSRYNGNRNNYYNGNGNGDDNGNNDGEREQACVVQCFFNELNLVDQRGFPERSAVIGIMTQNLQDPELRDFVEESIIECYHYLNNSGRQEKCQFSQNLLSCLAEKGSERCEDWDDE